MKMRHVLAAIALCMTGAAWADATLVDLVKSGDSAAAHALIKQRIDVNKPEVDGTTALHWAVHNDDTDLVKRLIKAGANAAATNDYGATPMSEAAVLANPSIIEMLLKAGADPESPNADSQTALMVVARTSTVAAAALLLDHGADVNAVEQWRGQTALMWASAQNQPAMVKLLIDRGADVNARSMVNKWERRVTAEPRVQGRPVGGLTPLLYAAREGCLDCAMALVKAGADLKITDPEGISPLLMANINAHFDVAAWLLANGANPNKWDKWGRTPLYAAVDYNTLPRGGRPDRPSLDDTSSLQMIELLLKAGANPNAQLKLFPPYRALGPDRGGDQILTIGATPLLRAAKAGDTAAIAVLLAHDANPNVATLAGITPVMAAAGVGGAKIDTRGRFKTQAEAVAAIDLLVKGGADINAKNNRGQTALHGAAFQGWNDVVQALVDNHADVYAKDTAGLMPLDSALGKVGPVARQNVDVHQDTADLLQKLMDNRSAQL